MLTILAACWRFIATCPHCGQVIPADQVACGCS